MDGSCSPKIGDISLKERGIMKKRLSVTAVVMAMLPLLLLPAANSSLGKCEGGYGSVAFAGGMPLIELGENTLAGLGDSGLQFYPLPPVRFVDTRTGQSACVAPGTPVMGGSPRNQMVRGICGIPATAKAIVGNLSLFNLTTVPGFVTLYPGNSPQPLATNIDYGPTQATSNSFVAMLGTDGSVNIFASTDAQVVIDINGYFAPPSANGLRFIPITPTRMFDTSVGAVACFAPGVPLRTGETRSLPVPNSQCGIPATAKAYSINVTASPLGTLSFLTIWPTGQTQPSTSFFGAFPGRVTTNSAIVPAGTNGSIDVFAANETDLKIDINGYFSDDPSSTSQKLSFYPVTPCRVADTRTPNADLGGPILMPGPSRSFVPSASTCGIPATARAYSFNVTVVPQGPLSFLTLWPTGSIQPMTSTLSSFGGGIVSKGATVEAGTGGSIDVSTSMETHLILDINGYFLGDMSSGGPRITGAQLDGKELRVTVQGLKNGSGSAPEVGLIGPQANTPVILMDGKKQKTVQEDETTLSSKKAGKKIKKLGSGTAVRLQVKDTDGSVSDEFLYVRP
jgi:hypothetical protein